MQTLETCPCSNLVPILLIHAMIVYLDKINISLLKLYNLEISKSDYYAMSAVEMQNYRIENSVNRSNCKAV